jgi:hypothetical protein
MLAEPLLLPLQELLARERLLPWKLPEHVELRQRVPPVELQKSEHLKAGDSASLLLGGVELQEQ